MVEGFRLVNECIVPSLIAGPDKTRFFSIKLTFLKKSRTEGRKDMLQSLMEGRKNPTNLLFSFTQFPITVFGGSGGNGSLQETSIKT